METDKEKVYDEQIAPLMSRIIEICKDEQIPMFAEFQYNKTDFVTTNIKYGDSHLIMTVYLAMSKCKASGGINIDKFLLWVMKNFENTSSACLELLGKKHA